MHSCSDPTLPLSGSRFGTRSRCSTRGGARAGPGGSQHRSVAAGGENPRIQPLLRWRPHVGRSLPPRWIQLQRRNRSWTCAVDKDVKVRASYELLLVDQSTGLLVSVQKEAPREFHFIDKQPLSIVSFFVEKRSLFESPTYLRDDCLAMECIVTVIKGPETKSVPKIQVPESDISGHYAKLLEEKVGVDVTFLVGGEEFTAHKVVLAACSPVFKAQLFGPMREGGAAPITIEDMQPAVFRKLLHFIYTDSLPPLDYLIADARTEMIRHLLVAADRYGIERLSLMCQSILCEDLWMQTVATTFVLADQHHCDMLKDACLEFITCSTAMDAVKKTQGYKNLKRTCPLDVIEAFEKVPRSRKA